MAKKPVKKQKENQVEVTREGKRLKGNKRESSREGLNYSRRHGSKIYVSC